MSRLQIAWHQQDPEWERPDRNLSALSVLAPLAGECDVWVLPEMFATGFTMNPDMANSGLEALDWMHQMAKDRGMVLAGSLAFPGLDGPVNRFFGWPPTEVRCTMTSEIYLNWRAKPSSTNPEIPGFFFGTEAGTLLFLYATICALVGGCTAGLISITT